MKRALFLFTCLFALALAANAQGVKVGSTIDDFKFTDLSGKAQSLNGMKGKNGAVLIFVSAQCPVVKGYNERMNEITTEFKEKGVNVIGINSNSTESLDWVKSHAESTYKFPVLIDKGNVFADKLGAESTPEVYYIDSKNVLLYHGAIDDDRSGENVRKPYLKAAFDSALSGKPVAEKNTKAFGCTIKKVGM